MQLRANKYGHLCECDINIPQCSRLGNENPVLQACYNIKFHWNNILQNNSPRVRGFRPTYTRAQKLAHISYG